MFSKNNCYYINKHKFASVERGIKVRYFRDWILLEDDVEYLKVYLRPVIVKGERKTLLVDNFSITPLAIFDYDLDNVTLDTKEWSNVYSNPFVCFETLDLEGIANYIGDEDYRLLTKLISEIF